MPQFVPLGSARLSSDHLLDEQMYANDGEFTKGVRAGVYGMGSGLRNAVGAVADAFDYDEFAAQQYGKADELAQRAGRSGPRVSSLEQLKQGGYNLGDIGDYALGTMGSALPSMGVGLGAAALSGGALVPSLLAGTAAYTPMEMGDAVAKWRHANPGQQIDGDTALRLGLTGLGSAAAQSIVPAAVGGKLAGRGMASLPTAGFKQAATRNLAEIPLEGFTEGLGEGIKQVGATPDAPLDWGQIGENTVAGMVGGAPMVGIGALGDYAHGNAGAVRDTASRAAKAVGKALEGPKGTLESAKTATEKGFGDAWTALSEMGESAWKGASDSDLGKTLSERVANTQQRIRDILDDPTVPAEWKAKVEAAAKAAGNKTNAAMVRAVDLARNKAAQVREDGVRKATIDTLRDSVDAVINGDFLGDKDSLLRSTTEQAAAKLRESAEKGMTAAKAWGEDLLRRKDVDPETQAEVGQAMNGLDQEANRQKVASKWKAFDAKDKLVGAFNDLKGRFKKGFDSATEDDGTKKSEDYSGVRAVIGEALRPHMLRINEAIEKDPEALGTIADSLRLYVESITDTQGKTDSVDRGFARVKLVNALGDSASEILADVAEAVGTGAKREQTEKVFTELSEIESLQRSHGDLLRIMSRALPKGQERQAEYDLEKLMRWATGNDVRGQDVSQAEIRYRNQKMESDLTKRYGAKAKVIMSKVEQMLAPKTDLRVGAEDEVAGNITTKDDPTEASYYGSGVARKTLVLNPEIHAAQNPGFAGQGTANELMKKLRVENPDAAVRFVPLVDNPELLDRIPAEKRKVTLEAKRLEQELPGRENEAARQEALQKFRDGRVAALKGDGMGMIEVSRMPNGKLTRDEIEGMRMDTSDYGHADHPSRMEIKPAGAEKAEHVFDAVAVTKAMMKRINREREWTKGDDIDALTRMGRAFADGVAALTAEFGRFKVTPDLVIGYINDKAVTAAEALKADKRTIKDFKVDDQTMEAVEIRKRLSAIEKERVGADKAALKELHDEVKELRYQLRYLENSREGRVSNDLAAKTTEDLEAALQVVKKKLVSEPSATKREALLKEMDFLTARLDNANERSFADDQHLDSARQDADPLGNIHQAAARLKAAEIEVRQNMDGSTKTQLSASGLKAARTAFPKMIESAIGAYETSIRTKDIGKPATAALGKALGDLRSLIPYAPYMDSHTRSRFREVLFTEHNTPRSLSEMRNGVKMLVDGTKDMREKIGARKARGEFVREYENIGQANSLIRRKIESVDRATLADMINEHERRVKRYEKGTSDRAVEVTQTMYQEIDLMKQRLKEMDGGSPGAKGLTGQLQKALSDRLEYLNNPPADYSPERARQIATWADRQIERLNAEMKGLDEAGDKYEALSDARALARQLLKKARSVIEGDESLKDLEGTPDPKAVAAKKAAFLERAASGDKALVQELQASTDAKGLQRAAAALNEADAAPEVVQAINDRLRELVKDENTAYGMQTRKYSLEGADDGARRLITRLADARRSEFAHADEAGVFRRKETDVRFGPVEATTRYFVLDRDGAHAFVIPRQFVRSVEATLTKYPADRHADVLTVFALQHAFYDPTTTQFESFGPNPKAPAGDLLVSLDALKDTGKKFSNGVPVTAVDGVSARQLTDFLADALAYSKQVLGKETIEVNWSRTTGANEGKRGGGMFSRESVGQKKYPHVGPAEPLDAKAVREHLFKVLGDTVQVEFANLMYAGDFTRRDAEDIIRISVHALNPMTVAYHESLHAFFQQLKDKGLPDVVQAVFKGLNTPHVMRQLRERLKDSPEALAQLADPEERAAYAFQFWASDPTFKLTAAPRTVFEKIAAGIRKVLGIWSNDERALEIFKYFHSGKYQQQTASRLAIHTATMRAGRNSALDTAKHMVKPLTKLGDAIIGAGSERLRDSGIPALRELADIIKLRGTDEGRDAGYIPAAQLARTEHMNWLATHLQGYGQDVLNEALEAMQAGRKAGSAQARIVQMLVQKDFLRERMFDKYLPDAGVKLGDLGPDYFPRVWDPAYISKNQEAFAEMLHSYGVKNADEIMHKIISGAGTEWGLDENAQIEVERPGFLNANERKLGFISGEDALPFLQKDFWKTMDSYVTQATRRGEWSRRFGFKNERYDDLLDRARRQGATEEQIKIAEDYTKAVNGTLGDDIDPSYRRLMGNMIVYQNIRLLPLAIFSSLVDPLGVVVRGGTVRDGWDTFKRGIKELRKGWQKEPKFDADTMLAEQIGTIEDAMLQHTISSMYGQGMMGDTAQKINDLFFRYNLMEGFNRSMRVGATKAALGFIGRHAKGANEHSTRYLAELGLTAKDVQFDAEGRVVIDDKVKLAVNRWVDGAVLRPDAADTPIWMHDPHYALFAHLKQFAFSFHHTFLKRVWHEYQHGNYKPIMVLASFVPMMMAADFVKDMITNGGDEPEWKRQWTFMDHVGYGVERAGILGVGQFALDGLGDIQHGGTGVGALAGPTIDQLLDGVSMLGGRREFSSFALRSMPANALYRGYMGEGNELEFDGDSMN